MRVDCIAGVRLFKAHAAEDDRGATVQLQRPEWEVSRYCVVHNPYRLTLRGFHYQHPGMHKIVTCTAGKIYDVLVDTRRSANGRTLHWTSFRLLVGDAVEIPPGVAHGYMTMTPNASLAYLLEGDKNDNLGLRWDDPKIGIEWPVQPAIISTRDKEWELR